MKRFQLIHVLSREQTGSPLNEGRITVEKCEQIFHHVASVKADGFFLCGPEAMIFSIRDWLVSKNIDAKKIHFELFNTSTTTPTKKQTEHIATTSSRVSHVTINLDDTSFHFDLPFDNASILDAGLQQGADLPYSCKSGVCTTCKAKLLKGKVEMDVNYGLEPEELADGFVLTCQSHPVSEEVIIDFDVK